MTPNENKTDPTWSSNAWLEIDRAAFEANIRTFQDLLGAQTRICAVMKSDAGAVPQAARRIRNLSARIGRVCIAALTQETLAPVAAAIAQVLD